MNAANSEGHAVEIGDLLRRQIERAPQDAGKDEHAGHAEDVLQAEDQELAEGQLLVDADIEDFLRRRIAPHCFNSHVVPPVMPTPLYPLVRYMARPRVRNCPALC